MKRRPDLPEPEWWARARYLSLTCKVPHREIAVLLNKSYDSVKVVFNLRRRALVLARAMRYEQTRPKRVRFIDHKRAEARKEARERWRKDGYKRELKWYYRDLDCM